jgi:hypothetical protein
MATKLRRCLYIGLGGTGMNAILQTKKMFVENYNGEVPPMIGFLGIDTDGGAYDKKVDSKYGPVSLLKSEQCPISVKNPKDYYLNMKEELSWLPGENSDMITTLDKGAGQVRTNGRLAFVVNKANIERALQGALAKIRSKDINDNDDYELLDDRSAKDEIHMVFSVCGGTGCGTFLDMAYLIRHLNGREVNITGYAVLPDVFNMMVKGGNAMAKTKPNAYGAIQDLDFLMHMTPASKTIQINWINETYPTNDKPFNVLNLVDNKNENRITYQHVDELTEMISLALISAAGQIGTNTASVGDNVEKCMIQGDLNVGDKTAWVSCIGACEIVFKGNDVAEVYSLKAADRIVKRLLNSCESGNSEANRWIDSPEVSIRENNGNDNVIDTLLDKEPKFEITQISDCLDAMQEVNAYYASVIPSDAEMKGRVQMMRDRVVKELNKEVRKVINQGECGVRTALDTLMHITSQVKIFMNEMSEEQRYLEAESDVLKQQVDIAVDSLVEYQKKLIRFGRVKAEKIADVTDAARNVAVNKLEIMRRIYANQFFTALMGALADETQTVKNVEAILKNVSAEYSTRLNNIQNQVGKRTHIVEVDLAEELLMNVSVNDDELVLQEFIAKLPTRSLYDLKDSDEAKIAFENYTGGLNQVRNWKNRDVDDVIDELSEEDFTRIVKRAVNKAMPLLKVNGRGKVTKERRLPLDQAINKYYYVCVPDVKTSRFTRDDNFKNMNSSSDDISFISSGLRDKIIIYRQEGTVPAFAIECLDAYKREYERSTVFCHFDANIYRRMQNEGYDLLPTDRNNDAVELWVSGVIFGFVKFEKGTYWYRDWKEGSPLKKFWINTEERDRDLAFSVFNRYAVSLRKQYQEKIDELTSKEGTEKVQELISDVKENYFEKYSQCEISLDAMEERGNEGIAALMTQELNHVANKL